MTDVERVPGVGAEGYDGNDEAATTLQAPPVNPLLAVSVADLSPGQEPEATNDTEQVDPTVKDDDADAAKS